MGEIWREHKGFGRQIRMLAKLELKTMFKGSVLGSAWAVVKPVITLLMFWFTFVVGIRASGMVAGFPRFDFMLVGFVPWFFMSDSIRDGAKCIRSNAQYVTKVSFPVSTVMTFTGLSRFYIHMVLMALMYGYLLCMGYGVDVYQLQVLFYAPLMLLFFLALSWTTASWSVFSKDFLNLLRSLLTGLFWMSGIVWNSYEVENPWLRKAMLLNPVNFFANGYRKAFLYREWFWEDPLELGIFLAELVFLLVFGAWQYRRLRKDMADVL